MSVRRVVVTGGPGAGKTVLLDELARRGYPYAPESARTIIRERLARGLPPRPDPGEFAYEILGRDIEQYRAAGERSGRAGQGGPEREIYFFDRSILDALGMLDQLGLLSARERDRHLTEYPYHPRAFILPPWEAIYQVDSERDQTFAESVRVHDSLRQWYVRCGYEIVSVPPGPVADRCDLVLKALEPGIAPRRTR
ncbi:MAG TPA: AAA family ATPase [Candidatus Eisenbacteria bacterium]|nr:AAA family ATPase [Candidatus Eisenbacteria bacterium]